MAIKEKNQPKKSALLQVLTKEYKYENLLLAFLAIILCAYSAMIIKEELYIKESAAIIGSYPKAFAWCLMAFGVFSLLLVLVPFFRPAVPELRKITWADRKSFGADTVRVMIFMCVMAIVFVIYDYYLVQLFEVIYG